MKILIYGLDARGGAIARFLVDGGNDVGSGDRGIDSLPCDMLIFTGPRGRTAELLERLRGIDLGTLVVDAMEGMPSVLSRRVVRAAIPGTGMNVLLSGSDAEAVGVVGDVFHAAGYAVTEREPLAVSCGWYIPPR